MADETLAPDEGALEPVDAPPADDTQTNDTPPDPIEALAAEMGWAPKDQFRGDADEWKPAAEFIRAGRDINRNLSKELRGLRDQVNRITTTSSQLLADKIAERDAYWAGQHAKAVEEGDVDAAERAATERFKLKQAQPDPASVKPPETVEFESRNQWFGKDPGATARAHEIAERLAKLGYDIPTQLTEVESTLRRERPELFPKAAKTPASVQTAATRSAQTSSRAKGFADMPSESQKMALEYEQRHGIKRDDFAKSYWADQAKQRRA